MKKDESFFANLFTKKGEEENLVKEINKNVKDTLSDIEEKENE